MGKHRGGLPVLLLMVLLALVPLVLTAMLAAHAGQECEVEGCELCASLGGSWSASRGMLAALLVALGGSAALALCARAALYAAFAPAGTPVRLRVRMNH